MNHSFLKTFPLQTVCAFPITQAFFLWSLRALQPSAWTSEEEPYPGAGCADCPFSCLSTTCSSGTKDPISSIRTQAPYHCRKPETPWLVGAEAGWGMRMASLVLHILHFTLLHKLWLIRRKWCFFWSIGPEVHKLSRPDVEQGGGDNREVNRRQGGGFQGKWLVCWLVHCHVPYRCLASVSFVHIWIILPACYANIALLWR